MELYDDGCGGLLGGFSWGMIVGGVIKACLWVYGFMDVIAKFLDC